MPEQRQPEIDSLRGLAVLLVLFDHFGINAAYGFPWGIVGVKLLFVFSGYFITRQILKELQSDAACPRDFDLAGFYRKRVLRLVPVLYAAVLLGVLFNLDGAREYWGWHLGFSTNYLIMGKGEWPGAFSHFWSLGLQMQFYLIWPMLMVWLPARWRGRVIAGCFLGAFAFRFLMIATGGNEYVRWLHLPGTLDAFAMGALVAWIEKERSGWSNALREWRYAGIPLALASLWCAVRLRGSWPVGPTHATMETFECMFLGWLFLSIRLRVNPLAPLLRLPGLPAVGTVSFGLYAFHPLVENASKRWLYPHMGALAHAPGLWPALLVVLSLGAAAVCHLTLERRAPDAIAGMAGAIRKSWGAGLELLFGRSAAGGPQSSDGAGMGWFRMSGALSALVVVGVMAVPIARFYEAPTPYPPLADELDAAMAHSLAGGAHPSSERAKNGTGEEQATYDSFELGPEFDWGYLPFGQMYEQSPSRDIEITTIDEVEIPDEA